MFPDLYFEKKDFETTFNLTYEDLFILDENNKYIFLIYNNRFTPTYILGTIFLRKYQLIFNVDSKTIGYYKSMNLYKEDNIDYNNDKKTDKKEKEKEEDEIESKKTMEKYI